MKAVTRKRCASVSPLSWPAVCGSIVLPALNDDGAPCYDKRNAEYLAGLGVPTFACTPDKFPDLMAAALSKQDIGMWASKNIKESH